jgi:hypothetical protein
MPRTSRTITFSLPPETAAQVEEIMKEEGRTRNELLRKQQGLHGGLTKARAGRNFHRFAISSVTDAVGLDSCVPAT